MSRLANNPWIAIGALWLAALAYYLSRQYLHPDVSWALVATGRMLDGARLYRDIIEVNPPLIFYSAVPAVLAAKLTGWPVMPSFIVYVLLLIAASLALTARVLDSTAALPQGRRGWMILAGFLALALLPVTDFGEREHFTAILTLPYVALLSARFLERDCDAKLAAAAGLAAGIGFAFKPYFLIVPAALELYLLARRRSLGTAFRPETIGAGLAISVYAAAVYLAHPEYFERIVPFGLLVYSAYTKPLMNTLLQPELPTLLLALLAYVAARVYGRASRSLDAYAIAAGSFFVAYLAQAKGWSYHLIPVAAFLWMSVAGAVLTPSDNRAAAPIRAGRLLIATMAVALFCVALGPVTRGATRSPFADRLAPIVRSIAPAGSLYAFTSHVWVAFPLVPATGLDWASRFPGQWLLPGVVNSLPDADSATRARLEEVERFVVDAVIEDLERNRPEIVLVDLANPYFAGPPFDYLGYFERYPRFRSLWSDYVKVERFSFVERVSPVEPEGTRPTRIRLFDIYCRPDTAPGCAPPEAATRGPPSGVTKHRIYGGEEMVGATGFEPATPRPPVCGTRHAPKCGETG